MAPQKRKQPHDAGPKSAAQEAPTRRSTRQHPDANAEPEHQLRSGRARATATEKSSGAGATRLASRGRKSSAPKATTATAAAADPARTTTTTTTTTIQTRATATRHKGTTKPEPDVAAAVSPTSKENVRPPSPQDDGRRPIALPNHPQLQSRRRVHVRSRSRSRSRSPPKLRQSKPRLSSPSQPRVLAPIPTQQSARPISAASASGSGSGSGPASATAAVTATPKRVPPNKSKTPKPPGTPRSDRNIDTIVFGNTCFKAWYPSYYGKEVLGDVPANVGGAGGAGAGNAKIGGGKRDLPMLDRLYVCPCCFKYSKDVVPWWKHVQYCEKKAFVPGSKIYTHPRHSKTVRRLHASSTSASPTGATKGKGKSRSDSSNESADVATVNEGEWSVWEVDGEKDGLFCQNLSLFAKLFLDNKSVFFDVTGFNYFLLVYTPPLSETHQTSPTRADPAGEPLTESENIASAVSNPQASTSTSLPASSRPQIVGFFSKEKMSWDNNNLACILVFPPWQRKGLGALLMGVSYEISRREGILGGPEKPISELGRKGYKRFWAGEISRWILELDLPETTTDSTHTARSTRREKEREKDRAKDKVKAQEGVVVDVEQCSRDTWIVPEDCLVVLREMGVVEEAGLGPPRTELDADGNGAGDANTHGKEKEDKESKPLLVPRVRIDKAAVRKWTRKNDISLTRACDPDGFVEGYAIKQVEDNDEEE
ncbi:acyl-CoA N-acyltransferase [Xylaria curta]|nr:acyl-CoA N-acyltransferase [Xylaria curta]